RPDEEYVPRRAETEEDAQEGAQHCSSQQDGRRDEERLQPAVRGAGDETPPGEGPERRNDREPDPARQKGEPGERFLAPGPAQLELVDASERVGDVARGEEERPAHET